MTFPFGNPAGKVGGGMHFADMHIFQPPGSTNYSMEWRTGHCVLPECYAGRARATGWMRSNVTMQTKNGTGHFMWGVDNLAHGSTSPYSSELDKSPAPACSLLTFPDALFEGKVVQWCKKPFCPLDSPTAQPPPGGVPLLAFDDSFIGGAVIQRGIATEVWGTAPVGTKTVSVKVNLMTVATNVKVDAAGSWIAALPAHAASYDCTLTVSIDSAAPSAADQAESIPVSFGDVILCGIISPPIPPFCPRCTSSRGREPCAVLCGAVRCGAVRCGAVRCGAVWCGAVRCGAVLCCHAVPGRALC